MRDSRRRFLAAMTAGVTGLLAGCGGNSAGTPTESTTMEPTTNETDDTATETDTRTESTATETAMEGEPTAASTVTQTVSVAADGLNFSPETFEIAVGDTVRWEWEGSGHNVRPDTVPDGSDWSGTEGGDGTTYGSGHTYSHTFDVAGEYSYYCAPHQGAGMVGSFTATE